MKNLPHINRRHFVKLGTLAATAVVIPTTASAAAAEVLTLSPLPYATDALEPHIDKLTMEIHHGKHHAAYIKNYNVAIGTVPDLAKQPLDSVLAALPSIADESLRTTLRNNGGGHWNHDFFWKTLVPAEKSGKPSAELAAAVDTAFGSMDAFKKSFGEAAAKRFGSGWAWLIVKDGKLKITSTANQDNPAMKGIIPDADLGIPLLGLDVWEHAYYLHYQNRRPDYVTAWWNIVDWAAVSARFAAVK
ncbi:MAG: superoxide dismutase [Luteolibacter sp.]